MYALAQDSRGQTYFFGRTYFEFSGSVNMLRDGSSLELLGIIDLGLY